MGKKDTTVKLLTKDNEVFAEIFNRFLFGEEVVDPAELREMDTTELAAIAEKTIVEQKYRDVLKKAEVKTDNKFAYLLLGIENQSELHYAMAVRTMLYDALNYFAQIRQVKREIRKGRRSGYSDAEWLGGFPKGRTITPVISLVLCWSPEKWDAPKSLYEMMDPDVVRRYGRWIEDYKINLVSVHDLPDELLETKTEIGLALEFSKYSNDNEKIREYQNDRRFENRSNEFVATINEMTGSGFRLNPEGGNVNMREGLRKLQEEAAREATREAEKKAVAKEAEDIRNSYELMEEVAPDLDRESKVQLIARKFKKSVRYVNSILA